MRLKNILNFLLIIIIVLFIEDKALAQQKIQDEVNNYLSGLPFKMEKIKVPTFPDKTFNIKDFGAVGDGHIKNTDAFRKAIEACSKAGGGIVIIPPGSWLTGPIELKSNINLHAERGALIIFSPDHKDYPIIKPPGRGYSVMSPVYGANLENVAITGEGIFDGNGQTWRPVKKYKTTARQWKELLKSGVVDSEGKIWWPSEEALKGDGYLKNLKKSGKKLTADDYIPARDYMRPYMFLLVRCKNLFIEGITAKNSPKFAFYPTDCKNVIFRKITVNNEWWAQNGDAIDINTCKNVLVYKCTVNAGDDGICMKSNNYDKSSDEAELRNIVIRDNIVYHGHGGFVIGSNTDGGMKNIFVDNCNFIGTDIGLRFKSARDRGGLVENIFIKNIFMKDIVNEAILFSTYYENEKGESKSYPVTKTTPIFKNFFIDSIYCNGAKQAVLIDGLPEMPIQDVSISNSVISARKGFDSRYATRIVLNNVKIIPERGNVFNLNETDNFTIKNGYCPVGTNIFLSVEGNGTKNIKLINTPVSNAKTPVEYRNEVSTNAVIQK